MQQYNYPTIIYSGSGALKKFIQTFQLKGHKKVLVVTDPTLVKIGLSKNLTNLLTDHSIPYFLFSETHPNPIEEDVSKGTAAYRANQCDSIVALGGGSPMDVAKVIKIMVSHDGPLAQYDDALGGDALIVNPMPALYAIPTTAGTGSEVGRSGVIIMKETGKKTIFFHPKLMPDIAVLEPELTLGLPQHITAATGIDAFTHNLEAYFAPGFHPLADGIALEGIELILKYLPVAYKDGKNLEAREKMQIAAAMGATAFQKGLGMIHSMAHPLSSRYNTHHGLANALLLPASVAFLEAYDLNAEQKSRLDRVSDLFKRRGIFNRNLSESCFNFIKSLGINMGLANHGIKKQELEALSADAFADPCHASNMIKIKRADLLQVYQDAF